MSHMSNYDIDLMNKEAEEEYFKKHPWKTKEVKK